MQAGREQRNILNGGITIKNRLIDFLFSGFGILIQPPVSLHDPVLDFSKKPNNPNTFVTRARIFFDLWIRLTVRITWKR